MIYLMAGIRFDTSYGVYVFTLFKILNDIALYTPLNETKQNFNYEMNFLHFK